MRSPSDSESTAAGLPTAQPPKRDASAGYHLPLSHQPPPTTLRSLTRDIKPRHSDLPLFACSVVSGLCDSVTINQIGNTIFLALGASRQPADEPGLWLPSLVSIVAFALGCFCFSNTRRVGPRRKGVLALSFSVQGIAILAAASLAKAGALGESGTGGKASGDSGRLVLAPIALLAWQFGGQISSSRMLGFGEVPTCVLTSVYCDLLSDPKLFQLRDNPKRNRRVMAIVTLLVGGIVGGWIQRAEGGMFIVLWVAAGIKFALAIMWGFWKGEEAVED